MPHTPAVRADHTPRSWIGIDVSKETLDVCVVLFDRKKPFQKTFENNEPGISHLLAYAKRVAEGTDRHFCLESTGPYSQAVAVYLATHDEIVSVVNPFRVKHAGLSQGAGNKTDRADARLIADYCRKENPRPYRLCSEEVRTLLALTRRLEALKTDLVRENNRLEDTALPSVVLESIRSTLRFLKEEIQRIEHILDDHIDSHPDLKEDRDLLLSIPGIGKTLAAVILSEMPDVEALESAQAAAAYAGLNPKEHRSGTSVHKKTRLSKAGNARLRKALFRPAQSARQWNPLVRDLCDRLLARGLTRMQTIGAAMRKLLMLAYGVLKSRQPFQEDYALKKRRPSLA